MHVNRLELGLRQIVEENITVSSPIKTAPCTEVARHSKGARAPWSRRGRPGRPAARRVAPAVFIGGRTIMLPAATKPDECR